jgi:hypothetical protein
VDVLLPSEVKAAITFLLEMLENLQVASNPGEFLGFLPPAECDVLWEATRALRSRILVQLTPASPCATKVMLARAERVCFEAAALAERCGESLPDTHLVHDLAYDLRWIHRLLAWAVDGSHAAFALQA